MSDKPTPFVSDEQIAKRVDEYILGYRREITRVTKEFRDLYEARLSEVMREMDELREEVNAMMTREAHLIQAASHEGLERGYAQGYADGISVTKHNP